MIEKLSIKNFKSIKDMSIDCKRINLFIGEPNTGKSNILETLGLGSWLGHYKYHKENLKKFLRFQVLQDLFHDNQVEKSFEIVLHKETRPSIQTSYANGQFSMECKIKDYPGKGEERIFSLVLNHRGEIVNESHVLFTEHYSSLKYYKFLSQNFFKTPFSSYLLPPHGSNLFDLTMGNKEISETIAAFYESFNLKLMLKPRDNTFEITKQQGNVLIAYPYTSSSDTLQRMIFFSAAMESNKDSTLTFEEPESFAFPYYTKYLGERIAFDDSNQYFISTHNPYLLMAILEKTPRNAVNVFITYLKDYQTRVKQLTEEEISELIDMEADPFFNLGYFLDEEHE